MYGGKICQILSVQNKGLELTLYMFNDNRNADVIFWYKRVLRITVSLGYIHHLHRLNEFPMRLLLQKIVFKRIK